MTVETQSSCDIRCPFCFATRSVEASLNLLARVECSRCGKAFARKEALPPLKRAQESAVDKSFDDTEPAYSFTTAVIAGIPVVFIAVLWGCHYHQRLDGPAFFGFMILFFIGVFAASLALRVIYFDSIIFRIYAIAAFETIGVHRIIWGYANGKTDFFFLGMGMIFGGVILFLRASHFKGVGGGYGGYYGGGCAGCGGCGGGCGGCGGS